MIAMKDKRFIEESFPAKEVSEISAKRKNIRHGHIYMVGETTFSFVKSHKLCCTYSSP